jgi:hypothetical protein
MLCPSAPPPLRPSAPLPLCPSYMVLLLPLLGVERNRPLLLRARRELRDIVGVRLFGLEDLRLIRL